MEYYQEISPDNIPNKLYYAIGNMLASNGDTGAE